MTTVVKRRLSESDPEQMDVHMEVKKIILQTMHIHMEVQHATGMNTQKYILPSLNIVRKNNHMYASSVSFWAYYILRQDS